MPKIKFKIGDTVRIKPEVRKRRGDKGKRNTAKIANFYDDIEGGVRLDKELDGFVSWNVEDLEKI